MSALVHRNYAAALKILTFVERHDHAPISSAPNNALFRHAVLGSSTSLGMTSLQLLLSSLTPQYDARTQQLRVTNVPPGFTAQQLLKLFHTRYPSVYRAEVYKASVQGSTSSDSESSSYSDADSDDVIHPPGGQRGLTVAFLQATSDEPFPPGRPTTTSGRTSRTSRALQRMIRRRRRNRHTNIFESENAGNAHQRGVVHFGDITQLRAALKEMQEFRVASSLSRTTAFGHTSSTSVLRVHVSNSEGEEEGEVPVSLSQLESKMRKDSRRKLLWSGDEVSYWCELIVCGDKVIVCGGDKVIMCGDKVMVCGDELMVCGDKVMVCGDELMVCGDKVMV